MPAQPSHRTRVRLATLLLLASGVYLSGCDRKTPAGPSTTPPPPSGPASVVLAVAAGGAESLPAGGGAVRLVATVADASGSRLSGIAVSFSASAGALSDALVNTDASGQALTTLTTGREAVVMATAGGRSAAPLTIRVERSEQFLLRVLTAPEQPRAGADAITFIASVSLQPGVTVERYRWNFGDGSNPIETRDDQTTHAYRDPGLKVITVVVALSNGYQIAAGRPLEVLAAAPAR